MPLTYAATEYSTVQIRSAFSRRERERERERKETKKERKLERKGETRDRQREQVLQIVLGTSNSIEYTGKPLKLITALTAPDGHRLSN